MIRYDLNDTTEVYSNGKNAFGFGFSIIIL